MIDVCFQIPHRFHKHVKAISLMLRSYDVNMTSWQDLSRIEVRTRLGLGAWSPASLSVLSLVQYVAIDANNNIGIWVIVRRFTISMFPQGTL